MTSNCIIWLMLFTIFAHHSVASSVYVVNSISSKEYAQSDLNFLESETSDEAPGPSFDEKLESSWYLPDAKIPQVSSIKLKSYASIGELMPRKTLTKHLDIEIDESPNDIENTPPPPEEVAKMARYIVTNSNWTSIATISSRDPTKTYPFANIVSLSDGSFGNGTGVPYMYLTPLDLSAIDLKKDPRASLTMSLAQSHYCYFNNYDPEDPRCAHIILSGEIKELAKNSSEFRFGKAALFLRHPVMSTWPKDHGWFVTKLQIENIQLLDYFGGAKTVSVTEYFNV